VISVGIAVTCAGCYLLKLAGLSVPERWLAAKRVRAVALLLPIALLAGLTAVQVVGSGRSLHPDARLAGLAAAVVCLKLRAPFIVVVLVAAGVAAGLRAVT
jgi:Branched-chain amino acid transport protein (AzlD)